MWGGETTTTPVGHGKDNVSGNRGVGRDGVTNNDNSNMYLYWAIQECDQRQKVIDALQKNELAHSIKT